MNLQLIKFKRQNVFDYNLLSDFMVKKKDKLIFNGGFGYTGDAGKIKKKEDETLFKKFERVFQVRTIIKRYKEIFHLKKKLKQNYFENLTLPLKNRETPNIKLEKIYYFSQTMNFMQKTTSDNYEKELTTNKSTTFNNQNNQKKRKLLKNISQDYIYLFGKNKIIINNKKDKDKQFGLLTPINNNIKTPFKNYEGFNKYKTKIRLKKNFQFFQTNEIRNYKVIKQEEMEKIRDIYEKEKNIEYKFCFLPSHYSVKKIVRKAENHKEKN